MMNQNEVLVEKRVLRSHKQVKKRSDHKLDEVKAVPTWANAKKKKDKVEIRTTRATTNDKMGMLAARATAKMSSQGEMPSIDTMGGVSPTGCSI